MYFLGGGKKDQKVAKCNFATLQLFMLQPFFNCFLIKKGKKHQKLQSCKVAFCNFLVLFSKNPGPKKFGEFFLGGIFWVDFFSGSIFLDHPLPYLNPKSFHFRNLIPIFLWGFHLNSLHFRNLIPIFFCVDFISTVCISETLSLFVFVVISPQQFAFQKPYPYFLWGFHLNSLHFRNLTPIFLWGMDLNSFHFRNLIPIFLWGMDLNSFHFRNLIPIFLWGFHLNSFHFRNLLPIFFVGISSQQFAFQKPYPYFFVGYGSQQFLFQKPYPYFFCGVWISTVFISETFSLRRPYHPLISQVSISKNLSLRRPYH